jgi:hypothetical protein
MMVRHPLRIARLARKSILEVPNPQSAMSVGTTLWPYVSRTLAIAPLPHPARSGVEVPTSRVEVRYINRAVF